MGDWNPWEHLEESGYTLLWASLPHVARAYVPALQTIVIDPEETATAQRSALAEELAHLELAHQPVNDSMETARTEQRARRWAAARLVDFDLLCDAFAWTDDLGQVAEMLDVDPDLVSTRIGLLSAEEREVLNAIGAKDSPSPNLD